MERHPEPAAADKDCDIWTTDGDGVLAGTAWTPHLWLSLIVSSGFMGLFVAQVVLAVEQRADPIGR